MSEKEELSISDIVREMGVHEKTVRRWIDDPEMPLIAKKNISGHYRIKRSDLNNFIQKREEKYNSSEKENK